MGGLLLGLLLRLDSNSSMALVLREGVFALVRSLIWFVGFAIFERNPWPPRACALALAAGVGAALLHLCVSPGIDFPGVAVLLWIAVGLALNMRDQLPVRDLGVPHRAVLALAAPVVICVAAWYFLVALGPVASAVNDVRLSNKNGNLLRAPSYRENTPDEVNYYTAVTEKVIEPLKQALRDDPGNARVSNLLAQLYLPLWRLQALNEKIGETGVLQAIVGENLDPHGRDSYLVELQLRLRFAQAAAPRPTPGLVLGIPYDMWLVSAEKAKPRLIEQEKQARLNFQLAAAVLEKLVRREPNDAPLRYQLAETWFLAGEPEKTRDQAEKALELDAQATTAQRRLSDPQREQVRHWVARNRPRQGG